METRIVEHFGSEVMIGPHSLGKLIEWKHRLICLPRIGLLWGPHSLGKLIEWKRDIFRSLSRQIKTRVPTRWGN